MSVFDLVTGATGDVQIYDPNSKKVRMVRNIKVKLFDEGRHVMFDVVKGEETWPLFMSESDFQKYNPDVSYE